jgi:transposase
MRHEMGATPSQDLLRVVLGLPEWWTIDRVDLTEYQEVSSALVRFRGQVDVDLEPVRDRLRCPQCGAPSKYYDRRKEQVWEHLPVMDFRTFLHARPVRVRCPEHGVPSVAMPWTRSQTGFTLDYEFRVLELAREMPVLAIARQLGVTDQRLGRVIRHWGAVIRQDIRLVDVRRLAIDEKHVRSGQRYATMVVDRDRRSVVWIEEGRDAAIIGHVAEALKAQGGDPAQVAQVTIDMAASYIRGVEEHFPQAQIPFDKFHVVKAVNEAVDAVRREEQRAHQELKGVRWLFLHNRENLQFDRKLDLDIVLSKYPRLGRAYALRQQLQDFYVDPTDKKLKVWYFRATHSKLLPMIEVAKRIKRHWQGVLEAAKAGLTNAIMEGINSKIQQIKARARGFRNLQHFFSLIFLSFAPLDRKALIRSVE